MITDFDLEDIAIKQKIPLVSIFMKDKPPKYIQSGGYIINLQDESLGEGGTHWVAIWFPPNKQHQIAYMDSFGFIPPQSIINWVRERGGEWRDRRLVYSDQQIQNEDGGGCGIYCMFFIDFMNKHQRQIPTKDLMKKWEGLWSKKVTDNLTKLKQYASYYKNS